MFAHFCDRMGVCDCVRALFLHLLFALFLLESGNNTKRNNQRNPYAKQQLTKFEFQSKFNKQTFQRDGP